MSAVAKYTHKREWKGKVERRKTVGSEANYSVPLDIQACLFIVDLCVMLWEVAGFLKAYIPILLPEHFCFK